ncbi:Leucine-rich repeat and fibronectin type-III domain-containing protein 5 [Penaeus vannamei]|uniref:Leucine-rich repeat and fibronectin type-III domain-containing protein 5 n=1 Tax=Penaeus vannamei TaxID=6689 RepID=A0A423TJK3_PENVA|nr:Leucine-rich repeat and fibronectin type-III domain-containing protein 5 [Penaeus vannamei]
MRSLERSDESNRKKVSTKQSGSSDRSLRCGSVGVSPTERVVLGLEKLVERCGADVGGMSLSATPTLCECKWRDGKEVVACRNAHFIDIPRGLDPSTQVLDLRHNNLRILPRDSFVYTGLVNLQKVWLSFCNLKRLEKGAFRMLANVVELDLSNNLLQSVPTAALTDMGGLRHLILSYNKLTTIPKLAFAPTAELVNLDLSHNNLTRLEGGALQNLVSLEVLDLSSNKLVTLDAQDVMPLTMLRVLHLDGNPWHCDCLLRPLRNWMLDRNLAPTVPPTCTEPMWLEGGDWLILDDEDFVCAPQVTALAPRVLAAEGENVSLACRVESEVETTITWVIGESQLYNASESQRYSLFEFLTPFYTSRISNLTIMDVTPLDQGQYRCVAENRAGRREVNLTLQVSHEVAEVRVANIDNNYMKGGLLGGICILVVVLLIVCSLIYCKVRSGRQPEEDADKTVAAHSSRAATADEHKLAGYHIVPTNELEVSPRRPQQRQSWRHRDISMEDFSSRVLEKGESPVLQQEPIQGPSVPTTAPSNVSYVDIAKTDAGGAQMNPDERTRWRDLSDHQKDVILHRMCHRAASQASVGSSNGQYPDLLDLPQPQVGQLPLQDMHQYGGSLPLHSLNPSFCTMPRTRARAYQETGTSREGGATQGSASQPHAHNPHDRQQAAGYRSSSALNLALSEAASQAYAHGQMPVRGHPFLPPVPMLEAYDPQAMHELIATHRFVCLFAVCLGRLVCRSQCGAGCGQMEGSDPYRFEYHAAQLEKFLQEYRCLQEQLFHMKQSYQAQQRSGSAPRYVWGARCGVWCGQGCVVVEGEGPYPHSPSPCPLWTIIVPPSVAHHAPPVTHHAPPCDLTDCPPGPPCPLVLLPIHAPGSPLTSSSVRRPPLLSIPAAPLRVATPWPFPRNPPPPCSIAPRRLSSSHPAPPPQVLPPRPSKPLPPARDDVIPLLAHAPPAPRHVTPTGYPRPPRRLPKRSPSSLS